MPPLAMHCWTALGRASLKLGPVPIPQTAVMGQQDLAVTAADAAFVGSSIDKSEAAKTIAILILGTFPPIDEFL